MLLLNGQNNADIVGVKRTDKSTGGNDVWKRGTYIGYTSLLDDSFGALFILADSKLGEVAPPESRNLVCHAPLVRSLS